MIISDIVNISKIESILSSPIISFDTETTGLNTRKDKVIGFSISNGTESAYIVHQTWNDVGQCLFECVDKGTCISILKRLLDRRLIMFNAPFDCNITLNYFGVDLVEALDTDVMLLAHTINENEDSYGLKNLARKYLEIETNEQVVLKAELKKLGTKDYYKIPLSIMGPYAVADAKLTIDLFEHLRDKQYSYELFYSEIMPMLTKVVIPMIRRGVAIDLAKLLSDQVEIKSDIERLEHKIQTAISPYLIPFRNWFYEKFYPMKSRGKLAALAKWHPDASPRSVQILAFKQSGGTYEFNINSDVHMRMLFFDMLKATPLSHTEGGLPRADGEFLESVAEQWNFAADMVLYNKLQKIKSTYIDRFIEEQEDGIFYPQYFMHRTVSGRLSGDMQQLPRPLEKGHPTLLKYNNNIRNYFVSRKNHVFIDDDYNSLEPRVFASVAGDQALKDIFSNNEDFYSKIAIMVEKLEGVSPDKSVPNYLGKVNKAARQTAKAYSLGIAYGLDDYKLHKDLNITQQEAAKLVKGYFDAFPMLKMWQDNTKTQILTTGQVSTRFGRVRHQPEVVGLYMKHGPAILNALDLWKKYMGGDTPNTLRYTLAKKDYKVVRHAINNAYNHQIQGLSAHIMNRAAIKIAQDFKERGLQAIIIAQIHDELLIECPESERDDVANIIKSRMETTTKIEVDLVAIPSYGYNMRDAKGD